MQKTYRTVAIIDSGIGGVSVLKQLIEKHKVGNYIYYADNLYMPYGNKSKQFIISRIDTIIKEIDKNYKVDIIIIACNTASSCIDITKYKNVICLTFDKDETYLATCLTKKNVKANKVISDKKLAKNIEDNIHNKESLKFIIKECVNKHNLYNYKRIILGCTHYELVVDLFKEECKKTMFLCNSAKVVNNIKVEGENANIHILLSKASKSYIDKIKYILYK